MTMYGCDDCAHTSIAGGCPRHNPGQAREMVWPKLEVAKPVPHRCPVCEGRKTVDAGFYMGGAAVGTNREICQTCNGAGILWS